MFAAPNSHSSLLFPTCNRLNMDTCLSHIGQYHHNMIFMMSMIMIVNIFIIIYDDVNDDVDDNDDEMYV